MNPMTEEEQRVAIAEAFTWLEQHRVTVQYDDEGQCIIGWNTEVQYYEYTAPTLRQAVQQAMAEHPDTQTKI